MVVREATNEGLKDHASFIETSVPLLLKHPEVMKKLTPQLLESAYYIGKGKVRSQAYADLFLLSPHIWVVLREHLFSLRGSILGLRDYAKAMLKHLSTAQLDVETLPQEAHDAIVAVITQGSKPAVAAQQNMLNQVGRRLTPNLELLQTLWDGDTTARKLVGVLERMEPFLPEDESRRAWLSGALSHTDSTLRQKAESLLSGPSSDQPSHQVEPQQEAPTQAHHVYLEADSSSGGKFWEARVEGSSLQIRYGKVGQEKSWKATTLATPEAALKEAQKKERAKVKKGYEPRPLPGQEEQSSFEELFGELRSLLESPQMGSSIALLAQYYTRMSNLDRPRVRAQAHDYVIQKLESNHDALREFRIRTSPCSTALQQALLKNMHIRTHPKEDTYSGKQLDDAYHLRAGAWIEAFIDPDLGYIGREDADHGKHPDGTPVMYMSLAPVPPHGQTTYDVDIMDTARDPMVVETDETGEYAGDYKKFSKFVLFPPAEPTY